MIRTILQLMRFNKPIGIYLLWFPSAWAITLAYQAHPPVLITLWFALGTIVMRAAGCVINDIADRQWDGQVQRTAQRPLAQQTITLTSAWMVLFALLLIALLILIQLPKNCFYGALPAVVLTFIYPFCKRFFATPQLFLGLAFTTSIPMVVLAANLTWNLDWTILWLLSFIWIIAYDTQYALSDIEDDRRLGIRSSAIFFKNKVKIAIYSMQALVHGLWLIFVPLTPIFLLFWSLGLGFWIYQAYLLRQHQPLQAFKNNAWYGLWMWVALYCTCSI